MPIIIEQLPIHPNKMQLLDVVDLRSPVSMTTRLICHSEIVDLTQHLQDALGRERNLLYVRGVPGIGKSVTCIAFALSKVYSGEIPALVYFSVPLERLVVAEKNKPMIRVIPRNEAVADCMKRLVDQHTECILLVDGVKLPGWNTYAPSVADISYKTKLTIVATSMPLSPPAEFLNAIEHEHVSWHWDEVEAFVRCDSAAAQLFREDPAVHTALTHWHPDWHPGHGMSAEKGKLAGLLLTFVIALVGSASALQWSKEAFVAACREKHVLAGDSARFMLERRYHDAEIIKKLFEHKNNTTPDILLLKDGIMGSKPTEHQTLFRSTRTSDRAVRCVWTTSERVSTPFAFHPVRLFPLHSYLPVSEFVLQTVLRKSMLEQIKQFEISVRLHLRDNSMRGKLFEWLLIATFKEALAHKTVPLTLASLVTWQDALAGAEFSAGLSIPIVGQANLDESLVTVLPDLPVGTLLIPTEATFPAIGFAIIQRSPTLTEGGQVSVMTGGIARFDEHSAAGDRS